MNLDEIYEDDISEAGIDMELCEQPLVLYQFTVPRSGNRDTLTIIGDRAFVEDGGLVICREHTTVAAFPPGRWDEMTSDPILPMQAGRTDCCRGPIRECPEDYCEE
jgi:hypothetical protein